MVKIIISLLLVFVVHFSTAHSAGSVQFVRWTAAESTATDLKTIVQILNQKLGENLTAADFILIEDRKLATSHYLRYHLVIDGIPAGDQLLRIWIGDDEKLIQSEAALTVNQKEFLQKKFSGIKALSLSKGLSSEQTMALVADAIKSSEDQLIRETQWNDYWIRDDLVRLVVVKGRRGKTTIEIDLVKKKVISVRYKEFPTLGKVADEFSLKAKVFPVYEEAEKIPGVLDRVDVTLKGLKVARPVTTDDMFAPLKTQKYLASKANSVLGMTEEGRKQGFWSMDYVKGQAASVISKLNTLDNSPTNGMYLYGKHATINLHPDAIIKWGKELIFKPSLSASFLPMYLPFGEKDYEMIPSAGQFGSPLMSYSEAYERKAERSKTHDPLTYINQGFDEIQVYYAIEELFEVLNSRGFSDENLSTRPFHAFLYDPDISSKDNAYYTDDTINFATYSGEFQNMARDNTTIWHELGHGVMDRLMGEKLVLNDTGGLSEGMADFISELVLKGSVGDTSKIPGYEDFRIINNIGFYLTNEVHDDGEAYGGTMRDLLELAIARDGLEKGLLKVTDLTLEAMRLTRDHPALTAEDWFLHMYFADSRGAKVRKPGELKSLLDKALSSRNFRADGLARAEFKLLNLNADEEVTSEALGSRDRPIRYKIALDETVTHKLGVRFKSSDLYKFDYPLKVVAQFNGGPLQGAVHWVDEEKGSLTFEIKNEAALVDFSVSAIGKCDYSNRTGGGCKDFVYLQVFDKTHTTKPIAKKRFYLVITNP